MLTKPFASTATLRSDFAYSGAQVHMPARLTALDTFRFHPYKREVHSHLFNGSHGSELTKAKQFAFA